MPGNPMIDANCEIILRDSNLEDVGEITKFIKFESLLKLNDVSSWQLDLQTNSFERYGIDETMGIMFYRDNELILDGPIMSIKQSLIAGSEQTTIVGGCDLALLNMRICYPVVSGPIFDTDPAVNGWRFGVKRSASGIRTTLVKTAEFTNPADPSSPASWYTPAVLTVASAVGFAAGNTCDITNLNGAVHPRNIVSVDLSNNTITVDEGDVVPWPAGCNVIQTSGGLVDDPAFVGYDTRVGPAETVAKELVYLNAGAGACSDSWGSRAIPFLEVAISAGQGETVTANSRAEILLDQVRDVCASGGINFSIKQMDNRLVFDVSHGTDRFTDKSLIFSVDGGNLKEYDYTYGPPTGNFVMGAGPQTGIDKLMLASGDANSIVQYGRREEWVSSGNSQAGDTPTTIAANMVQVNNLALAQSLINASLTLSIQENDQVRYPRDFQLGDTVGIIIGNTTLQSIISNISYSIPAGTGGAQGSAISAALTKTMTKQMQSQVNVSKLVQQLTMT